MEHSSTKGTLLNQCNWLSIWFNITGKKSIARHFSSTYFPYFSIQLHLLVHDQRGAAGGPWHQLSRHHSVLQRRGCIFGRQGHQEYQRESCHTRLHSRRPARETDGQALQRAGCPAFRPLCKEVVALVRWYARGRWRVFQGMLLVV